MGKKEVSNSKDNSKKVQSKVKLITPIVMLLPTAIVAIYTYFQRYNIDKWLIVVFGTMVLFLVIGSILENMVRYFEKSNKEKEEKQKQEELSKASMGSDDTDRSSVDDTVKEEADGSEVPGRKTRRRNRN